MAYNDERLRTIAKEIAPEMFGAGRQEYVDVLTDNCYTNIVPKIRELPIDLQIRFATRLLYKAGVPNHAGLVDFWRDTTNIQWLRPAKNSSKENLQEAVRAALCDEDADLVMSSYWPEIHGKASNGDSPPITNDLLNMKRSFSYRVSDRERDEAYIIERITEEMVPQYFTENPSDSKPVIVEAAKSMSSLTAQTIVYPGRLSDRNIQILGLYREIFKSGLVPLGYRTNFREQITFYMYHPQIDSRTAAI